VFRVYEIHLEKLDLAAHRVQYPSKMYMLTFVRRVHFGRRERSSRPISFDRKVATLIKTKCFRIRGGRNS